MQRVPPGGGRQWAKDQPGNYRLVSLRRGAEFRANLSREGLPEALVLEDRRVAPPREGVEAHQVGVRSFSGRLFGDRQREDFDAGSYSSRSSCSPASSTSSSR